MCPKLDQGNKRSVVWFRSYVQQQGHDVNRLWREIADICVKTVMIVKPKIAKQCVSQCAYLMLLKSRARIPCSITWLTTQWPDVHAWLMDTHAKSERNTHIVTPYRSIAQSIAITTFTHSLTHSLCVISSIHPSIHVLQVSRVLSRRAIRV